MNGTTDRNAAGPIIVGNDLARRWLCGAAVSHRWRSSVEGFPVLHRSEQGASVSRAFVLLTFNFALGPARNVGLPVPDGWLNARKALGMTGFLLVLVHVLMSFMLFSPAVFGKFFEANGTLTGAAGISMLAGVLGFVFLWAYNLSFQTYLREDKAFIRFITSRRVLVWALLLGGVHMLFMGYSGWLDPAGWHGGLPPISLVAFAFFAVGYLLNLLGRE